ncbi:hypothetical protein HXX76_003608 [Chlamydomonas incerta]|uniref:Protein kinase domain-containing protein n=1 Tax=Chlamydomonas incerta TaxID=51695 RepID=A0A835TLB9_CHLIN|nr:hypothetical protein HXX76_003608 [Chlamydomonas incerta]|eukprot:KAG2440751.1 hypothetical protein HXX76_003608 [Chlamydomonas incerta]
MRKVSTTSLAYDLNPHDVLLWEHLEAEEAGSGGGGDSGSGSSLLLAQAICDHQDKADALYGAGTRLYRPSSVGPMNSEVDVAIAFGFALTGQHVLGRLANACLPADGARATWLSQPPVAIIQRGVVGGGSGEQGGGDVMYGQQQQAAGPAASAAAPSAAATADRSAGGGADRLKADLILLLEDNFSNRSLPRVNKSGAGAGAVEQHGHGAGGEQRPPRPPPEQAEEAAPETLQAAGSQGGGGCASAGGKRPRVEEQAEMGAGPAPKRRRQPDCVCVGELEVVLKLMEVISDQDIMPVDLLAAWRNPEHARHRLARAVMSQVYTYMIVRGTCYGFISCWLATWLVYCPANRRHLLYLSDPFLANTTANSAPAPAPGGGAERSSAAPGGPERSSAAPGGPERSSAAPGGPERSSAAPGGGAGRSSAAPGGPERSSAAPGGGAGRSSAAPGGPERSSAAPGGGAGRSSAAPGGPERSNAAPGGGAGRSSAAPGGPERSSAAPGGGAGRSSAAPGGAERSSAAPGGGAGRSSAAPGGPERSSAAPGGGAGRSSAAPGGPERSSAAPGGGAGRSIAATVYGALAFLQWLALRHTSATLLQQPSMGMPSTGPGPAVGGGDDGVDGDGGSNAGELDAVADSASQDLYSPTPSELAAAQATSSGSVYQMLGGPQLRRAAAPASPTAARRPPRVRLCFKEELSAGSEGLVMAGTCDGVDCVMKLLGPNRSGLAAYEREVAAYAALEGLQGLHVPDLLAWGDLDCGVRFLAVRRVAGGQPLSHLPRPISAAVAAAALRALAAVQAACPGFVHGDVRLSNMLAVQAGPPLPPSGAAGAGAGGGFGDGWHAAGEQLRCVLLDFGRSRLDGGAAEQRLELEQLHKLLAPGQQQHA